MSAVRVAACALFAMALLPIPCGAAQAADPHAVAAAVARELGVQDRLPSEDRNAKVLLSAPPPAPPPSPAINPGGAAHVLGWIALIFVAVFLGASLLDMKSARRRRALATVAGDEQGERSAQLATARASLSTADQLAEAGRYTEAIHQLLSDALALLRLRARAELPDALTSREIVRTLELPDAQRSALGAIVGRVEQTWFAQRLAAAEDYDAVRASFRVFTAAAPAGA